MRRITHKRGDTLTLGASWIVGGASVDLSSYEVASQIRTPEGRLIHTFDVNVANQGTNPGEFTIAADADATAEWPLGLLECDIEFRLSGVVTSSETFAFEIVKDITR